ncbi:DUF4376 domain-containing protein [Salmonella enterica]|nr:DUF4376 domain-containing protein [Salmonella enterica]EJB9185403.1 DUF4376 domain-containing protein [Salmonella enterica]EJC0850721.1 DUF4376 domain-containing protein [Salmonella enterica]EJX3102957.1 DUF4376 domain-containing protein [Salmonella enterica]EJX3113066.1 DUF4376 domain-containing protein [Salmonella enterica]
MDAGMAHLHYGYLDYMALQSNPFTATDAESDNYPDDLIPLTDEHYHELMQGQVEGKYIEHRKDGPVLVDYPDQSLEDARSQKHAEINRWRNTQENANYTLTFNNHKWDYGKATQERLTLSVQMAKANKLPAGFIWTDADNNDVPMTSGELLNLSDAIDQAMFTTGLRIHLRQREMKEELSKLTGVQAILAYHIGWPDGTSQ